MGIISNALHSIVQSTITSVYSPPPVRLKDIVFSNVCIRVLQSPSQSARDLHRCRTFLWFFRTVGAISHALNREKTRCGQAHNVMVPLHEFREVIGKYIQPCCIAQSNAFPDLYKSPIHPSQTQPEHIPKNK